MLSYSVEAILVYISLAESIDVSVLHIVFVYQGPILKSDYDVELSRDLCGSI
jgi:hypothetical protein